MKPNRSLAALSLAILISFPLFAQPAPDRKIAPLPWPSAARPGATVSDAQRQEDGFREAFTLIECDAFGLEIENKGTWQLASSNPRFSCLLQRRGTASYRFGVSVFQPAQFLKSLDQAEWSRYIESLKAAPASANIVFEADNFERSVRPYVLAQNYRHIAYETTGPDGEVTKTRELFMLFNDRLVVFTFRGSPAEVDRYWKESDLLLTRMNLAPEKKATSRNT